MSSSVGAPSVLEPFFAGGFFSGSSSSDSISSSSSGSSSSLVTSLRFFFDAGGAARLGRPLEFFFWGVDLGVADLRAGFFPF